MKTNIIHLSILLIVPCYADNMQNAFTQVFLNNLWGSKESVSGPGSTLAQTTILRDKIKNLFYELSIQTVLDAACGDFNWFKEIDYPLKQYIGIDIVPQLIINNNNRYKNDIRTFELKNLVTDELPQVDLIICRDCFVHLTTADVKKALRNFKKSGSTYVLMTTFTKPRPNVSVPHYGD